MRSDTHNFILYFYCAVRYIVQVLLLHLSEKILRFQAIKLSYEIRDIKGKSGSVCNQNNCIMLQLQQTQKIFLHSPPILQLKYGNLEFTRLFRITEISTQDSTTLKKCSFYCTTLPNNVRMLILYIIAETWTQVDQIRNAYFSKARYCTQAIHIYVKLISK